MCRPPPPPDRQPPPRLRGRMRSAVLAGVGALVLAGCEPPDPAPVALCKFAVRQAVAAGQGLDFVYTSEIPVQTGTRVELEFAADPLQGPEHAGAAECRVVHTRYAVRLRSFTLDGEPVDPALLRAIRANWTSLEDAQKLYQL